MSKEPSPALDVPLEIYDPELYAKSQAEIPEERDAWLSKCEKEASEWRKSHGFDY